MTKSPEQYYHEIKQELDVALLMIGNNPLAVDLTDMERIRRLMAKMQNCVISARRQDYRQFLRLRKARRA